MNEKEETIVVETVPEVVDTQEAIKAPVLIDNYAGYMAKIDEFLDNHAVFVIQNDEDKKKAKKVRAEVNAAFESLKRMRIDSVKKYVGTFEEQMKGFEAKVAAREKEFKQAIADYDASLVVEAQDLGDVAVGLNVKAKTYTITIKTNDPKVVEKLKKIALDANCAIAIK